MHRLHTLINKRGFGKVAGHVMVSFSGYGQDPREIYEIPEIREYWRTLNGQVPELPALVAFLPQLRFNGPGFHLMLLGTVGETRPRPDYGGYDAHVLDAAPIMDDALRRIQTAGRKYRLPAIRTDQLTAQFLTGISHRFRYP